MEQTTIQIDGMSCGHCVSRVQKALSRLEGVHVDQVEIGSARVTYDAGYEVRPATEGVA
jgi:copper chaperone CopZ